MSTKYINMSDPKAVAAATDEQFPERPVPDGEASRAEEPWASLQYEHACDRMNDEQFPERPVPDGEASRAAAPWTCLYYKHACDRMTDEQFPDRSVPDGENSLRARATDDFSAHPWVTERPGTDRP